MKRLLFCLYLTLPFAVKAQRIVSEPRAHHEFGLQAGVANYFGDLQQKFIPSYGYGAMGGIQYKYFFTPRLGLRTGAMFTKITAADSLSGIAAQERRHLRFATNIFEVQAGLEFNFLGIDVDRAKVSPYIFAGIAAFYANPYTDGANNERVYLRPLGTEGQEIPNYPDRKQYKVVNAAFPLGGGLKFFVGKTLVITTELGLRYCTYDYIDDVSKSYVPMDTLVAYRGQTTANYAFRGDELQDFDGNYPNYSYQRGDSKSNDWYWTGTLGVAIYFDAFGNVRDYIQTKCPGLAPRRSKF